MTGPAQADSPPRPEQFEITLLGPGYGESVVLHIGDGSWIIVDSCIDTPGRARPLQYLESIGVDPTDAVRLVVATHWHDDHIRGMATVVEACRQADFCCAAALCDREFLAVIDALHRRPLTRDRTGVREMHEVVSRLHDAGTRPTFASANKRLLAADDCEVWSLSPSDSSFQTFLASVGQLLPTAGSTTTRVPHLSPNDIAIALWVRVGDAIALLGSDLERKGWFEILDSTARPHGRATVFKVPHHGSQDADVSDVWATMLTGQSYAVLTPWRLGGHQLPRDADARRIAGRTPNAYITAKSPRRASKRRDRAVARTLRESGIVLRSLAFTAGAVRLRTAIRPPPSWSVETLGGACRLDDIIT